MNALTGTRFEHVFAVLSASLPVHRTFVIGVVCVAVGASTITSLHSRHGLLRRLSTGYVARIDALQRSMYLPATGATIGWIQFGLVLTALLLYGMSPVPPLLVVAIVAAIGPPVYFAHKVATRRAKIDAQANGFALALANQLKATASIGDGLRGALAVTTKPLQDEVGTVLQQIRVGSTLEDALLALSARVQSLALDVVVSALLIGRQTGGDLPRILETTSASLRELKRLEELTDKQLRSTKIGFAITAMTNVGLVYGGGRILPGFFDPLRDTPHGQFIAGQLALAFVVALYLAYRFTRKSV